jgi:putative transcriptional regulator
MTPRHHLDSATLLAYSAGALPQAFKVVAATHLAWCRQCRAGLLDADRVGGALMQQQEPAPLPAGARRAMLARVAAAPDTPLAAPRPGRAAPAAQSDSEQLPAVLHPYFGERFAALKWRRIGPGVEHIRARPLAGGDLVLLRVAPGRSVPLHGHGGNELTVLLRGAYDDVLGHFAAGDAADLDGETEHQPVTSPGTACICVAAIDAPLRFSGWLARLLQPVFRM